MGRYGHPGRNFHIVLTLVALVIGLAAYPIVRHISRRLERLQHGVELLGAGDLSARIAVEGHDEVARLARSFNLAAGRIELLVKANRALLANASHELRTPLARIRLAVELLKDSADRKRRMGLEQDIAELDWLVDEILLASRLDAVTDRIDAQEVDLLALAAEECARYDGAQLEGAPACCHRRLDQQHLERDLCKEAEIKIACSPVQGLEGGQAPGPVVAAYGICD